MKIILLAGGLGTRLWPLPAKQFLGFGGEYSLLQRTLLRFLKKYSSQDLVIVTLESFFDLARQQIEEICPSLKERIIAEKEGKNTAAAILFALKWLEHEGEAFTSFLISPTDHLISPESVLLEKIEMAKKLEKRQHFLFGVFPTSPHVGYGYIECDFEHPLSKVTRFIEKPPLSLAEKFLQSGNFLWHTGICLFQKDLFFEELKQHQIEMANCYVEGNFDTCPFLSIDHAFLEHSQFLSVLSLPLSWSDIGSWDGLYDSLEKDRNENVKIGEVSDFNTQNCLIFSQKKLTVTFDVKDLIIVDTEHALLIAKRGSSQQISFRKEEKHNSSEALDFLSGNLRPL